MGVLVRSDAVSGVCVSGVYVHVVVRGDVVYACVCGGDTVCSVVS